jgi:hypothetical protein
MNLVAIPGIYEAMRSFVIAATLLSATLASAEPVIHEDGVHGVEAVAGRTLLADGKGVKAAIEACVASTPATGSALFWVELTAKGAVGAAKVHGAGKPVLDTCLASALRKGAGAEKLGKPIVVVGRLELGGDDARISETPVMLQPHDAGLQVTVSRLGYTANRAADIAQSLDAASVAFAKCAAKRLGRGGTELAIAWVPGRAKPKAKVTPIVRSGAATYDACFAKVLATIELPTPQSAMWMQLAFAKPAEALAPRTDKVSMSKAQALRDAMTTALRSRKDQLLTCLDNKQGKLEKVTLELRATKLVVKKVDTGNAEADACVRKKLDGVKIPNAAAADKAEHEITLEREY